MEFDSPRWGAYNDTKAIQEPKATYAVSAQYAAYANQRGVFARKLTTNEHYKRLFRYEDNRPWFQPVLAFETVRGKLLAIATGVQILVFDVDTKKVKHTLKGNGRIITSLAWALSKPGVLATGAVDGSICVWSLKHSARPIYHVRAFHGACNHVAFHPRDHELLAGCHRNCISVWALPSTKPFLVTKSKDSDFRALRWFATDPLRVLGISSAGSVSIYDAQQALKMFRNIPPRTVDDSDDEDTMFGKLEDVGYLPASDFDLGMSISQAILVGRNGLIVLPQNGHILFFVAFFAEKDEATELWRLRLDGLIDCFSLRVRERSVQIVACMAVETQFYEIPGIVLDSMGWEFSTSANVQYSVKADLDRAEPPARMMRPELSIYSRLGQSPQSRKLSTHHVPVLPAFEPKKSDWSPHARRAKMNLTTITPSSMTSSLEIPKAKGEDDEHDSPMPFLSPSVAARRASRGHDTLRLDDSLHLPPPRASFDSITSTAGHDSDSDDETFAEHLRGSGSNLPGGVNVPLPRSCGACFGANGQLLVFRTTRVEQPSLNGDFDTGAAGTRERQDSAVTRLFPNFGNVANMSRACATVSESEGGSSPDKHVHYRPRYSVPASSFEDTAQWSTRVSPIKSNAAEFAAQQKVKIELYEIRCLQFFQRLAYDYRVLPTQHESASDLCRQNAEVALGASMDEAARLWHLLAVLLEQRACNMSDLALQAGYADNALLDQRPVLSRNLSLVSSYADRVFEPDTARLHWAHHPLGRTWAIERILSWAELQADVQLLACVSSLLIRVSETMRNDLANQRLASLSAQDYFANGSRDGPGFKSPPTIPLLRAGADTTDASLLDEFPVNPYSTCTSSRDPSMPNTPYIESSASTHPLTLPPLARQSTRLSASGSASPEAHRGSFSAAAKYYAQTISDKLAGYSTSPPTRRLGASPGTELSTSLPTGTGSWSKSVSFAAASDTARDSRRSLSLAQEEDRSDSDRTIDEMSLPRTPNASAGVVIRELNGQSFYNEPISSPIDVDVPLLPDHFATKCRIWRDSYAEQLRSWDLLIEAAELENIADLAGAKPMAPKAQSQSKVVLHMDPQCRGTTCCICFCAIKAAKHLCPACLHTTHPRCLEMFVACLEEQDDGFTCPTGCGCECTAVGELLYEVEVDESARELGQPEPIFEPQAQFAKKRSLTNPALCRESLEGNSW